MRVTFASDRYAAGPFSRGWIVRNDSQAMCIPGP